MRRLAFILAAALLLTAGRAGAQDTATPTNTATPVNTATATVTPTVNQQGILLDLDTCASAPCTFDAIPVGGGLKTITARTTTGTATLAYVCRNGTGWLASEVTIGTLTGATCSTEANCLLTEVAWCDEIVPTITACGSSCRVASWLRIDR